MKEEEGRARRYNKGKLAYGLIPPYALSKVAEVFTKGAEKYTTYDEAGNVLDSGANNWRKGMPWSDVINSAMRHIESFRGGEDFDPEMRSYHLANAVVNLMFILEYYKIAPQFDDRLVEHEPRIGLDVDEVLADFAGHYMARFGPEKGERPKWWNFDRKIGERFLELKDDKDFWMSMPCKVDPDSLGFEPACYITSRIIPNEWTEEWLDRNGFSIAPVVTVNHGPNLEKEKIAAAVEHKVEVFIDDRYKTYKAFNEAGIFCYLYSAPHNLRYEAGYKRLESLDEL